MRLVPVVKILILGFQFDELLHNVIFQFSHLMESLAQRGSEEHVNGVFEIAKFWLAHHRPKNILPDVLAIVEHKPSKKFFVGASVAVSDFVRPICLYNRITNFKESLGASVIHFCPLNNPDRHDWKFSYAFKIQRYDSLNTGLPCQNCRTLFQGVLSGRGGPTFLDACAEYHTVNEPLPNEQTLKHSQDRPGKLKLVRSYNKCTSLPTNYRDMLEMCITALDNGDQIGMERAFLGSDILLSHFWPKARV